MGKEELDEDLSMVLDEIDIPASKSESTADSIIAMMKGCKKVKLDSKLSKSCKEGCVDSHDLLSAAKVS